MQRGGVEGAGLAHERANIVAGGSGVVEGEAGSGVLEGGVGGRGLRGALLAGEGVPDAHDERRRGAVWSGEVCARSQVVVVVGGGELIAFLLQR